MIGDTHHNEARFIDRGDWPQALACLIFLIVFPLAIIAIWRAARELAPLEYIIPFTGLFALASPFLLRQVAGVQKREMSVDCCTGTITLTTWRPLKKLAESISPVSVDGLAFEKTEYDGYWYRAMLELLDSRQVTFAQGNHEPYVRNELARMAQALAVAKPDLRIREVCG
jgi:hypothetical protein